MITGTLIVEVSINIEASSEEELTSLENAAIEKFKQVEGVCNVESIDCDYHDDGKDE